MKFIPWTAILKLPVPWPRCQDISALVAKSGVDYLRSPQGTLEMGTYSGNTGGFWMCFGLVKANPRN